MKSLAVVLASLLSLTLATPSAQKYPPAEPPCAVILPIFYELEQEFTLVLWNRSYPKIHKSTVSLLAHGGSYRAVINAAGSEVTNMTLKDAHLGIYDEAQIGFLEAPLKTAYQQLSFDEKPGDAMEFAATYFCDNETNKQFMRIDPFVDGSENGPALEFCVAKDFFTGDQGLTVRKVADAGEDCVSVTAVVTDGL